MKQKRFIEEEENNNTTFSKHKNLLYIILLFQIIFFLINPLVLATGTGGTISLNTSFETSLTSDDVFTMLKVNEPIGRSIFTINTPEKIDTSKFGLKFIAKCGIVKSYTFKIKSVCEIDTPLYAMTEVCDEEVNKTTNNKCYRETKIIGYTKGTETCYKYTDYIEGSQDYEIEANILSTKCDDNTYGYYIDWVPTITINDKEIEQPKWAVWNGTGGTQYTIIENGVSMIVHLFTGNATFTFNGTTNATILIVAGGGGGGTNTDGYGGGGGGAGGLIYNISYPLSDGVYQVIVGSKGIGAITSGNGTSGSWSSFGIHNATGGGGGGGGFVGAGYSGKDGGSGGGGGPFGAYGGLQVLGQGYPGGRSYTVVTDAGVQGGGGGGGGGNGSDGSEIIAGSGGIGLNFSVNGTNSNYSCGGGGSTYQNTLGAAGCPGAGSGAKASTCATNATCYGCGGGAGAGAGASGNGMGGIVIIKYPGNTAPNIIINSPENNTPCLFINDNIQFNFTVNDDISTSTNCTLIINNYNNYSINNVPNNILTTINANISLAGNYTFHVSCYDGELNGISENRSLRIIGCRPEWINEQNNCEINDTTLLTYTDNNLCNSLCLLPIDNGTSIECNYCNEDITSSNTDCIDGTWTTSYTDNNFFNCCYITELLSDCSTLYPPYNEEIRENCTIPTLACEENLTNNFLCEYDSIPIMQKKMNVICQMPNYKYYHCIINILQNRTLLASNPEYKESTTSILNREGETRTSFQTTNGILNGHYTTKNLRTDTPFTLEIICNSNSTSIKSQYCITPTYIKPDWIINIWVWAKDNMLLIILLSMSLIFVAGIMIYYIKRL